MLLHVYVWLMFHASLLCCFRVVFLNKYYFVFAWLLLYVYVLGDVLDFVMLLFQSSFLKYIFVYSGWGGLPVVHIRQTY